MSEAPVKFNKKELAAMDLLFHSPYVVSTNSVYDALKRRKYCESAGLKVASQSERNFTLKCSWTITPAGQEAYKAVKRFVHAR